MMQTRQSGSAVEKPVLFKKVRMINPENTNHFYNQCMYKMTRDRGGIVKMPMRIYLCPVCKSSFFISPLTDSDPLADHLHCIFCGAHVNNDFVMSCNLTSKCFNPDRPSCDCRDEYSMIIRGRNPYLYFNKKPQGASFVRSVCKKIILSNTDDVGITSVPMYFCRKHKRMFTGNSEQRVEYCLYCGERNPISGSANCYLTKHCFDMNDICDMESLH